MVVSSGCPACPWVARCPPASTPCTTIASGRSRAAAVTSSGEVALSTTALPAFRNRATSSAVGRPNVNETSGTGWTVRWSSFAGYSSSTYAPGSGAGTPSSAATGARARA